MGRSFVGPTPRPHPPLYNQINLALPRGQSSGAAGTAAPTGGLTCLVAARSDPPAAPAPTYATGPPRRCPRRRRVRRGRAAGQPLGGPRLPRGARTRRSSAFVAVAC